MRTRDYLKLKRGAPLCEYADLSHVRCSNRRLNTMSFEYSDWSCSRLKNVEYVACSFTGAQFDAARLHNVTFKNCFMFGVCFDGAVLVDTDLSNSSFAAAHMCETDLECVNVAGANAAGCKFRNVNFGDGLITADSVVGHVSRIEYVRSNGRICRGLKDRVDICSVTHRATKIEAAKTLSSSVFSYCVLRNRDFTHCDMRGCCFDNCVITNCTFADIGDIVFHHCITG